VKKPKKATPGQKAPAADTPGTDSVGNAERFLDTLLQEGRRASNSGFAEIDTSRGAGRALLGLDPGAVVPVLSALIPRLAEADQRFVEYHERPPDGEAYLKEFYAVYHTRALLFSALRLVLEKDPPLAERQLRDLAAWLADSPNLDSRGDAAELITVAAERLAAAQPLAAETRAALVRAARALRFVQGSEYHRKEGITLAVRLEKACGAPADFPLAHGEAWSDAALTDLKKLGPKARSAWIALLTHCLDTKGGKPSAQWLAAAPALLDAVTFDAFKEHLLTWFPLSDKPRTQRFRGRPPDPRVDPNLLLLDQHVDVLKGLAWCCGLREDRDLARALAALAVSAYRKVPGKGPRAVSLGNACVHALSLMPGRAAIGQLAVLKVKIKFGTAQKEIEKAFRATAAREGLPPDEVEELAVPAYGLEEVGRHHAAFGDYRAELTVDGSSAGLHWLKGDKPIKSVPAAVKKDHAEEFKELQAAVKDINAMLPAQRERLDTLFLAQKSWPLGTWRERYLDHPLLGTIARRLIWSFSRKGKAVSGIWHDGRLVGPAGKPLDLKDDATVVLWHPIGHPTEEVLAWRDWLEKKEVVQPFKQAHREIYLLTDAERRTRTYSNRFAAHVLRQHQFNALCAARGWKNKLRLLVDDSYPPASRPLPAWGLRAEYWVEGAGDEYGRDTNDSGVFLYLTTDQVRFYRIDAPQLFAHASGGGYGRWNQPAEEPLPLEEVPPLVFSEVMRDVDLFVGVASVGNDPNWADGGPGGRYRDYWQGYSFGELSATAQTRRALLERLLPRLKIAGRCTLTERFLVVRGDLRGYKIHLGSGNILMTPNDQYLCIVPKQTTAGHDRIFLPFEGDGTLAVILSKAFLLAEDTKITDPTITNQLKR